MRNYNKELAINASYKILGFENKFNPTFNSKGEVVRDFKSELEVYVKQEEIFVLPDIECKYFDGHSHYKTFVESQPEEFDGDVKKIKLAEIPETKKGFSILEYFITSLNSIYSKFKKPTKEELIPTEGYLWIYFQMRTADTCKRKLAS